MKTNPPKIHCHHDKLEDRTETWAAASPNSAEFLLAGVKGKPPIKKKIKQSVQKFPHSRTHSRKPQEWMCLIEQVDEGPRLEMFARRKRHGWHVWGNELANDVEMPND